MFCVSYLQIVVVFSPIQAVGQTLAKEQLRNFALTNIFSTTFFSIVENNLFRLKSMFNIN